MYFFVSRFRDQSNTHTMSGQVFIHDVGQNGYDSLDINVFHSVSGEPVQRMLRLPLLCR